MRIEFWEGKECLVSVTPGFIPKGAPVRECYETDTEIIVCG